MKMTTPVVIFVYNRKKETKILLNRLARLKPKNIIIIFDGPNDNKEDKKKYAEVQKIVKNISWKCKKKYIGSKQNLGLKKRVTSGLNLVFDSYDRAIILEDDCIPNKSFFLFCEFFLDKFKNNKKIAGITGNNFQKEKIKETFYYSKFSSIWGWATWSRVWKTYDLEIKFWKRFKNSTNWKNYFENKKEWKFWTEIFDKVYKNEINSWAYSNQLCNWYHDRLTIVPKNNLIKNIGFSSNATNTKKVNKDYLPKVEKLNLTKIIYPKVMEPNKRADKYDFENIYGGKSLKFPRNIYYNLLKFKNKLYE